MVEFRVKDLTKRIDRSGPELDKKTIVSIVKCNLGYLVSDFLMATGLVSRHGSS